MAVSLNSIIQELIEFNLEVFISQDNEILVQAVKLLEINQVIFEPQYLYVGLVLDFPKSIPSNIPVNIICVTENTHFDVNSKEENLNLILIQSKVEVACIFNKIQSVFANEQKIQLKREKLINAFIHGKGLQGIINTAYKLLSNPIILIDSSSKLLSYCGSIEVNDIFWNDLVLNGYFSYESISMIEAKKLSDIISRNVDPVYVGKEIFDVARLISKIVSDNKIVGSIAMLEYEKLFSENDIILFKLLCEIISSEMQKGRFIQNSNGYMYESFITQILDGKKINSKIINDRIKCLDLNLKENLYVLTIQFTESDIIEKVDVQYLCNIFEQIISGSKCIIYDNSVVAVISCSTKMTAQQNDIKKLADFLKKSNMYGGVSRCFYNISNLQEYYRQSVKSIEYGIITAKKDHLYFYEKYVLYCLLDICQSKDELIKFCHVSIFTLIEYDNNQHTNNMKVLYTYLKNEKRIAATAADLRIHRNTLTSHIKTIEKVMNINLDDVDTAFHLYLTFKILMFTKSLNFKF
ncbi:MULTISPECIES: PucR family transcriptional regulator [Clostridium]|nr:MULTISPECIES: helix-turn-helix domain-containing protein [Clostridium]ADK16513.1 hypothetical protein CLJU_c34720 [Clostridium ljungdahlii DSM 13528]AGY75594.1 helix-turn-helix domain-containing protein [Clostridium autoethanogenum DSM 10061]ALU35757.1 putative transcriptional regulator PucR family [Clostridium autoethanogenum DSM 10061]OAA89618.1 carbohydrate diacid transcriptional activator CdaR [Clostridium ljungdahlii DSM 13528]OVY52181.1 carbohydrate diacid transcriptional activator Cd